jgi:hypothetical protein
MIRRLCALVVMTSACQVLDDVRYKPRVGPLLPDAELPDAPDDAAPPACPASDPGDACGDSNPDVAVSFAAQIQPLFMRTCMIHMQMTQLTTIAFDLATYASLRKGGAMSHENIIIPCKPCDSVLVQKLGPSPPFGVRMPNLMPVLPDSDMALLRDWIAEGALDN